MEKFFRKRIAVHPLHPLVLRMPDDKAVKKAAEKRAEKLRAGIKAVSGKAGDWTRQLVINGKKTKGTKA